MTNAALVKTARYASLLCCAILSGVAVTVLFLELALRQLNGPAYIRVRQAEFAFLTWYIGAVTVPALVAVVMLVLCARRAHSTALRPAVVALVLLLLALLVTLVVNGPVNVEELAWNAPAPPADWARVRDRWQIAHAVRTVAIVLALGCVGVAVLDRPIPDSSGHGGTET
ncbi:anthrone oxygenase family protein [Streptomyces sp. NPDC049097]|uniref:anthrone oxygenase family protein n=1 Tax=unclassified Streptomyces TaxID=2593676 RepID=UPI0033CD5B4D